MGGGGTTAPGGSVVVVRIGGGGTAPGGSTTVVVVRIGGGGTTTVAVRIGGGGTTGGSVVVVRMGGGGTTIVGRGATNIATSLLWQIINSASTTRTFFNHSTYTLHHMYHHWKGVVVQHYANGDVGLSQCGTAAAPPKARPSVQITHSRYRCQSQRHDS
jgi:hypothetical protein